MKKILIYCSLFILFGSCGNNSNTGKENKESTISQEENKIKENNETKSSEAVVETPVEGNNCDASKVDVYLNDPDDSGTNIRSSPGGDVVLTLVKKDKEMEFFLILTQSKDGWFKVKNPIGTMEEDIKIPNSEAWIHGSVISVNTRNYGGQDLNLLDHPKDGKVVGVIKEESYGLRIKDLCGTWVQVEYKGTIGWIEDKWLCGNPVTTCS